VQAERPMDIPARAVELQRNLIELHGTVPGDCGVCMQERWNRAVYHLRCGHTLHKRCVLQWRRSPNHMRLHCPLCRHQCFDGDEDEVSQSDEDEAGASALRRLRIAAERLAVRSVASVLRGDWRVLPPGLLEYIASLESVPPGTGVADEPPGVLLPGGGGVLMRVHGGEARLAANGEATAEPEAGSPHESSASLSRTP
jgi:hypothetical protein